MQSSVRVNLAGAVGIGLSAHKSLAYSPSSPASGVGWALARSTSPPVASAARPALHEVTPRHVVHETRSLSESRGT